MLLKTAPAVFVVEDTYQIMVPVSRPTVLWVEVDGKCYYDNSNGILRSQVGARRVNVPMVELNRAGKYTLYYREVLNRQPYFPELGETFKEEFSFRAPVGDKIRAYHIADAHNFVAEPVRAAKFFEQSVGELDFLILNGDIPNHSGELSYFDTIYEICAQITGGNIPVVFSRGNHDARGLYAENMADYTPGKNGLPYYTFRLGNIWGVLLDCGEDKPDEFEAYNGTICCHDFRLQETAFLEGLSKRAAEEYEAEGVLHKLVICHVPFSERRPEPFNIEEDLYAHWCEVLKETVKPDLMICGHTHQLAVNLPGGEKDDFNQPCPVVVASEIDWGEGKETYYAGGGFVFEKDGITVVFNDHEKVLRTEKFVK
ncbi:MAG: metallophosphoesterase [Clostridia bacterium]|nr:metallophosphoesterase [Clostridia bacterium]